MPACMHACMHACICICISLGQCVYPLSNMSIQRSSLLRIETVGPPSSSESFLHPHVTYFSSLLANSQSWMSLVPTSSDVKNSSGRSMGDATDDSWNPQKGGSENDEGRIWI